MVRQSVLPSFPIGVIFGSSCEHLQNQRNASIQVPPVIKSSCRIPQFSHGRPFVKVNLHCYVRAWATHAVSIISARRFLWCKMTASARIDRVLRTEVSVLQYKMMARYHLGSSGQQGFAAFFKHFSGLGKIPFSNLVHARPAATNAS